jgi:periplasmic protein TonB
MFNNLVESNTQETGKQRAYFGFATAFYTATLAAVLVWSIFSFDVSAVSNDNLLLETLVAPVVPENAPPAPPEIEPQRNQVVKSTSTTVDVLRNPVANIKNSTAPPDIIANTKQDVDEVRVGVPHTIGTEKKYAAGGNEGRSESFAGTTVPPTFETKINDDDEKLPPPVQPVKANTPPVKKTTLISKGVINSIAKDLPKPIYPAIARTGNVSGAVKVQVMIDEKGNVVSATVISGHPLLRAAAQAAARQAKFTPTYLSDEAVKVTGVIVYNFTP